MSSTRSSAVTSRSRSEAQPQEPDDAVDAGPLRRALGPHLDALVAGGFSSLGGLSAALTRDRRHDGWVQFGLTPLDTQWRPVLADLDWLATQLLDEGAAHNFFFMRKPPGLRVRFETAPEARDALADRIETAMTGWPRRLAGMRRTRYEPEEQLFGGAASMTYVHRLFTADSLAWLAYCGLNDRRVDDQWLDDRRLGDQWLDDRRIGDRRPPWLFSLAVLRELMNGLAIPDREDPKVWEHVRSLTGRNVPEPLDERKVATVAEQIRTLWTDATALRTALGDEAGDLADEHGVRLRRRAQAWRTGYFASGDAVIGARDAAAFATVFHWNRGGVSSLTQRLIAAALAERSCGV